MDVSKKREIVNRLHELQQQLLYLDGRLRLLNRLFKSPELIDQEQAKKIIPSELWQVLENRKPFLEAWERANELVTEIYDLLDQEETTD